MTTECHNPIKYRADIDGLRAISILVVVMFHADIGFTGGFIGVDVFFVISGYLITSLILKDLNGDKFKIMEFWVRRIRRIQPALAAVVLTSLVAGWFIFTPQDFISLGNSAGAQAMLASNFYFWHSSGYFSHTAELKPLLHTWSLAVEEQFYLLLPLLLIGVHRISRASISRVILVLTASSFILSIYCSYRYADANFYLLPTRAWELLLGAFLATIATKHITKRWAVEILSWAGLLSILCAATIYDRESRFPGIAAVLPCAGAALVIWSNNCTVTSVAKLLTLRPIVFIGLISYSLYLWHWPVLTFARYLSIDPIPVTQRVMLIAMSVVIAILSWKFIEMPFRKRLIFDNQIHIVTFGGVTAAFFLSVGLAIYKSHGVPSRLNAEVLHYSNGSSKDYDFVQKMSYEVSLKDALAGDFIELGSGDKQMPISLILWGDSHSVALIPLIDILCKEHSIRGVAAVYAGTAPLVDYQSTWKGSQYEKSIAYNDAIVRFIHDNHINNVIIAAKWRRYELASGSEQIRKSIRKTIVSLNASNSNIYIMKEVPKPRWDVPRALAITVLKGQNPDTIGITPNEYQKETQRQNPYFQGLSAEFSNVTILDPSASFLTRNGFYRIEKDGKALYCDDSHLSAIGAANLRPLFEPLFRDISNH